MPYLLNRMPFPGESGEIVVRGERVRIRKDQILIWMSLSSITANGPSPSAIPFPALLDTGHNHSFSINARLLSRWAGLPLDTLPTRGAIRFGEERIRLYRVNLWVHPNERGQREKFAVQPPHLLKSKLGIAVYPGGDFPRLPLLGLRAIAENGLVLHVDGPRRTATLRTPHWWAYW